MDLLRLEGSSALLEEWSTRVRAQWAARRAGASEGGGDGGAWLGGDAAGAITCDAAMAPVVTGEVNVDALEDLVQLCVLLDRHRRGTGGPGTDDHDGTGRGDTNGDDTGDGGSSGRNGGSGSGDGSSSDMGDGDCGSGSGGGTGVCGSSSSGGGRDGAGRAASPAREAIERAVISKAVDLVSGPGGLASFLRRRQLGARLGGPSLPLDVGYSTTIPAGIRNAVILRDRHCRWPGGCDQPAAACQVHHVKHKANGGNTSLTDCVLLCSFHHQVVIHRWGWTLVLNPTAPPRRGTRTKPKSCTATGHPPGPGNTRCCVAARCGGNPGRFHGITDRTATSIVSISGSDAPKR